LTERAQSTEFEPSATEPVQVILTVSCQTATETTIQVAVGGTVIAEDVNSKAATGTTKVVLTFIVPAGKKWKVTANAGITLIKSSYLTL
jgi:hypothetical protein